jgi:hypothetical protein
VVTSSGFGSVVCVGARRCTRGCETCDLRLSNGATGGWTFDMLLDDLLHESIIIDLNVPLRFEE